MNYSDWVLSIYDEYRKKCRESKDNNYNFFKEFKYLETILKFKLICFILVMIIGIGIYVYGMILKKVDIYILGITLVIIPPTIVYYMGKLSLQYYKENKNILEEILKVEGLNNEIAIKELIKETEDFFSRFNSSRIAILIKSVLSFITVLGPTYILSKIDDQIIINILIIIFIIIFITTIFGSLIYFMISNISGGKIARRREFNQLLKIILFYKQNSTKDIEDKKEVEYNKEINTKEINLK